MVAFWLLVFGLWHSAMVPNMDRDEPTPGLVAELVEAFRTSEENYASRHPPLTVSQTF